VATVTGLAAELRRARARCGGLPSWNSGQWGTSGVAGVTVVLLRWRMGGSTLAGASYGDGGGGTRSAVAAARKEEAKRGNEGTAECGRTLEC
jgi:hypothetical protein